MRHQLGSTPAELDSWTTRLAYDTEVTIPKSLSLCVVRKSHSRCFVASAFILASWESLGFGVWPKHHRCITPRRCNYWISVTTSEALRQTVVIHGFPALSRDAFFETARRSTPFYLNHECNVIEKGSLLIELMKGGKKWEMSLDETDNGGLRPGQIAKTSKLRKRQKKKKRKSSLMQS